MDASPTRETLATEKRKLGFKTREMFGFGRDCPQTGKEHWGEDGYCACGAEVTFETDLNFEDETIDHVDDEGLDEDDPTKHHYGATHGSTLLVTTTDGFVPKVGMKMRSYPDGMLGTSVRGVVIFDEDGQPHRIRYQTPQQARWEDVRRTYAYEQEKVDKYAKDKGRLDAVYAGLPPSFRARIDRFRKANKHFDREFGAYEFMVCEQAVQLAESMRPKVGTIRANDLFAAFKKLSYEEQMKEAPFLDPGHSGNSFGAVLLLAQAYLEDPRKVYVQHGALVGLVGCKAYGCEHPTSVTDPEVAAVS